MMSNKRMRMFAGPNGSGKSTVFNNLLTDYGFDVGIYLNADEIEKQIKSLKSLKIENYGLSPETGSQLKDFIQAHSLYKKAISEGYTIDLKYENDSILSFSDRTNSYEASILTDFLRNQLIRSGQKFSFETVMSHVSKIETLELARNNGFKNYLYFVSTDNVETNKARVKERVLNGGHPVAEDKIEDRYYRSLKLLKEAIPFTYRTFIFDNSKSESRLILDIYKGEKVIFTRETVPKWVDQYCLNN